jgi:GNAT superfamily N-acetyltransferase
VRELQFRRAGPEDAEAIASLHADSWRRHYRGAYADSFLDRDVLDDRLAIWTERLREPDPRRCTIVAVDDRVVGFAHTVFDEHSTWGALLDNLHVASGRTRSGIGSRLLALTAEALLQRPRETGMYVWVLAQNLDAQAFYEARGATYAGREPATPPGGVASRLSGSPAKLRYVWPEPSLLRPRP